MGFCGFFDLGLRGQWNTDNTDFAGLCGFFVCHPISLFKNIF